MTRVGLYLILYTKYVETKDSNTRMAMLPELFNNTFMGNNTTEIITLSKDIITSDNPYM